MPADPSPVYELARDQLAAQLSLADSLDAKMGLLLSTGSGLLVALAAVLVLRPHPVQGWAALYLGLAAVPYLVLAGSAGAALWNQQWGLGPKPRQVVKDYGIISAEAMKKRMAARYVRDFEDNLEPYGKKVDALRVAAAALAAETLTVALSLLFVAIQA